MVEENHKLKKQMAAEKESLDKMTKELQKQVKDQQAEYWEQIGVLTEQSAVLNDQLNNAEERIKIMDKERRA